MTENDQQPAWRTEFPIEKPQESYVARRDFVKFLGLTSLAFVVGQFWIAISNTLRRHRAKPEGKPLVKREELPVGGSKSFTFPGDDNPCVLVRHDENTWLAYGQKCTHLSCAVVPDPDRNCFNCPCHKGTFDLRTGRPLSGPPRRPLSLIKLEERDGIIFAVDEELRTV